jgi:cellulose synthase/poly-beta-1,6-N-acetylglucosamine synthase-like glycosyltransferase
MLGKLLGHILLEQELITPLQLKDALEKSKQSGMRLGEVLVGEGVLGYQHVYRALATYHQLPYIDLLKERPDLTLLRSEEAELYLTLGVMPWKREGSMVVIATSEISELTQRWAIQRFGHDINYVMTSPYDIRRSVEDAFSERLSEKSRFALWHAMPNMSAMNTMPLGQCLLFLVFASAFAASSIHYPWPTLLSFIGACHAIYFGMMLFKATVFIAGRKAHETIDWDERIATILENQLPIYTVLIPMYHEVAKLPHMLGAMKKLDYPQSKLDIKLVLEADDYDTLNAAFQLKPSYNFDIIRVPTSYPRTKPKACNYALRFARGQFVTVYDADDEPDPLQLKKAVWSFKNLPRNVICLQARLNYYNAYDNWLTRFFSLEYAMLFNALLHGLERMNIPIPLGGTSNHIWLSKLKELGEWDPFNVTEDADLGTRLAARGYKTAMIDSDTLEESPNHFSAWMFQRSRWIKGYMQTWLVHMRHPVELYQTLKLPGFIGFQFFIGLSSFAFLSAPIVALLYCIWLFASNYPFPVWLIILTVANLTFNFCLHSICALDIIKKYRNPRLSLVLSALTYPFYLIMHSMASYLALWQLLVKPHVWNKTTHGVAKSFIENPLTAD